MLIKFIRTRVLILKTQLEIHSYSLMKNLKKTFKKTGTTIVGLLTKDAVIIAADTRATGGKVVAEKNI